MENNTIADDPNADISKEDAANNFVAWVTHYCPDVKLNTFHVRVTKEMMESELKKKGNGYLRLIFRPGRMSKYGCNVKS